MWSFSACGKSIAQLAPLARLSLMQQQNQEKILYKFNCGKYLMLNKWTQKALVFRFIVKKSRWDEHNLHLVQPYKMFWKSYEKNVNKTNLWLQIMAEKQRA